MGDRDDPDDVMETSLTIDYDKMAKLLQSALHVYARDKGHIVIVSIIYIIYIYIYIYYFPIIASLLFS